MWILRPAIIIIASSITCKGIIMMKELVLLLVVMLNGSPMFSRYLLLQLEDANDEIFAPDYAWDDTMDGKH